MRKEKKIQEFVYKDIYEVFENRGFYIRGKFFFGRNNSYEDDYGRSWKIEFNIGMSEDDFFYFVAREFNARTHNYQQNEGTEYFFFNRDDAEVFCNFLNSYTQQFFTRELDIKHSRDENYKFFREFYDSYKVLNKLCGEIDDDWMKWL